MSSAPTKSRKVGSAQQRRGWSGVSRLTRPDQKSHLRQLVATLPQTKSGDAAVLACLADLRARFHGWLHQDEFGPSRGEQTAALRAHTKLVRELCQRLQKGTSRSRERL